MLNTGDKNSYGVYAASFVVRKPAVKNVFNLGLWLLVVMGG